MSISWRDFDLLTLLGNAASELAEVIKYGNLKHVDPQGTSWRSQDRSRHLAALKRHLDRFERNELHDHDSGLHPLAHVACRALFIVWIDLNRPKGDQ